MTLMTGRNQAAALGMPLGDALNATTENGLPLDGAQLIADVHEAEQVRMPVMLTTSDGRSREVALAVSPVPDADGSGQLGVVVARDVTAQREVEQAKQDFIATVSHELRTPLTPIKGYLTLLLRPDFVPDQPKRDAPADDDARADRPAGAAGRRPAQRLPHAARRVRHPARARRRAARLPPGHPRLLQRHERAVDLRLPEGPAMRSATRRGSSRSSATCCPTPRSTPPPGLPVHVNVRVGAHEVELSVRDEGDGVPLDQREVVFEPFRRLGDALTSTTRGTGLGLHIARQLIEAMNGRIWGTALPARARSSTSPPRLAREDVSGARHRRARPTRRAPSPSPAPSQSASSAGVDRLLGIVQGTPM